MGEDKAARPLFNGHSVLRRTRNTGAASEEEKRRLPLQKVNVGTLPLEWVRRRLNNKALRRGVARCPSDAGTAFVKPRTEFKNWRGRRQRNGEGRRQSRSVAKTYKRFGGTLHCCRREGRRAEKAFHCTAEG
ncbi:hypothetical protein TRVL_06674 [Trypanosoma vivax]|nr:hypothetical protein TRVL_06674 [Trypanosoma vivax]